ncbi:hypothetical protein GFS31_30050 [Leptolyngbya sp. BL0902]|nr:hypothetical protein GFS31_30050 [Leptolyngbya sp. BL0902]
MPKNLTLFFDSGVNPAYLNKNQPLRAGSFAVLRVGEPDTYEL